jgi:hydrogenase/urease accessory protein HupE
MAPLLLAHIVSTGVGPFYDGAAHVFVSLEELLPVLVVALLGGLRGPRPGRWSLAALALGWLAAGGVGLLSGGPAPSAAVAIALLMAPAVLVAADVPLPGWAAPLLALLFGAWTGFGSGRAMTEAGAGWRGLAGAALAAVMLATLSAGLAASVRSGWPRIVLRVAGSWIAALALLALGWTLRG